MQESNQILVPVFSQGNKALFLLAQTLLDNSGIEYFTKGENLNLAYGGPLVIEVAQDNLDEAKEVLRDLTNGEQAVSDDAKQKILDKQKSEFNYALIIGLICLLIILIFLAVLFVKC